jgi:hypothetical protein
MAVCEFCRATVVKDAGAVHGLGRMSEVLEDYSPIQIGTAGVAGGRQFTVIGRIQLRYASGLWNEWFVLFGDGATGWLGDSSGRYTLTTEQALGASWPAFDAIRPGHDVVLEAGRFVAAEKRAARCVGGQGELPFRVAPSLPSIIRMPMRTAGGRCCTRARPSHSSSWNASCCATTTRSRPAPPVTAARCRRCCARTAAPPSTTCPA